MEEGWIVWLPLRPSALCLPAAAEHLPEGSGNHADQGDKQHEKKPQVTHSGKVLIHIRELLRC